MKILKYILNVVVFGLLYMICMFCMPLIANMFDTNTNVTVYVGLGVILAIEYLFLFFHTKGRFFSIPFSFLVVIVSGLFYFNNPTTAGIGLGMWVLVRKLVVPYAISSLIVSTVLFLINKKSI